MEKKLLFAACILNACTLAAQPQIAGFESASYESNQSINIGVNERFAQLAQAVEKQGPDKVMAEQPNDGELVVASREAIIYVRTPMGGASATGTTGEIAKYVVATDGSIYLYNPLAAYNTDSWVKLDKQSDGTYAMKGHEVIYQQDYQGTVYDYCIAQLVLNEEKTLYVPDATNPDIVFEYNDGELKLAIDKDHILGLVDVESDGWVGYGDISDVLSAVTDVPVQAPDGLSYMDYLFTHATGRFLVKAAVDDNKVYIKNLPNINPDLSIAGEINDGKVVFADKQYLGMDEKRGFHFYLCNVDTTTVVNENTGRKSIQHAFNDKDIVFALDAENLTLTTEDCFVVNAGRRTVYTIGSYYGCDLEPWKEVAAKPTIPVLTEWIEYDELWGYGAIGVKVLCSDVDGNYITPEKMYYSFYIDDEVYVLEPDIHMVDEDMTEIPFYYFDNYISFNGELKAFYFEFGGFDRMGVQSIYYGGGERNESEILYVEMSSGVKDIDAEVEKTVETVVYTDLMGRRVENPDKGLYIKTVVYTDGTVSNTKIIQK